MDQHMRFQDKVLVCTGGASGIGESVARRFAAEGGRVAIFDLRQEAADAVANELDGSIGFGLDVADTDAVEKAMASVYEHYGRLDSIYTAAGNVYYGTIEDVEPAQVRHMLDVHVMGTLNVCRAGLPLMRNSGGGAIVNTASAAALVAWPNATGYSAAKGAIMAFTRTLAAEVGPEIRVNSLSPARVLSGITKEAWADYADGDLEEGMRIAGEAAPVMKRVAEASEAAAAVCFLLSDDASYITGIDLAVDGGWTAV